MSFKEDVERIQEIDTCYQPGLQALSGDSGKIQCQDTRDLDGSVNLDECVRPIYPNDSRWDYIVSYRDRNFFIEVHPASTGEVKEIVKKVTWLKQWLKAKGTVLVKNKADNQPFRWVASGKIAITKTGKYAKQLAQNGVNLPQKITRLD